MDNLKIQLINNVLVEVKVRPENNESYRETDSGLYLPNEESKTRAFNFGKVLAKPAFVTDEKYQNISLSVGVDDIVFFSASKSYNYMPQGDDDIKLLMIPLWDIDAIYSSD